MIGSIRGKIIYKDYRKIEIDVAGAGYEVFLSVQVRVTGTVVCFVVWSYRILEKA